MHKILSFGYFLLSFIFAISTIILFDKRGQGLATPENILYAILFFAGLVFIGFSHFRISRKNLENRNGLLAFASTIFQVLAIIMFGLYMDKNTEGLLIAAVGIITLAPLCLSEFLALRSF